MFSEVARALATGADLPAPLDSLWDGLEVFAAYDDDVEPAPLAGAAEVALGIEPDAAGLVDHGAIGDKWEASRGLDPFSYGYNRATPDNQYMTAEQVADLTAFLGSLK